MTIFVAVTVTCKPHRHNSEYTCILTLAHGSHITLERFRSKVETCQETV